MHDLILAAAVIAVQTSLVALVCYVKGDVMWRSENVGVLVFRNSSHGSSKQTSENQYTFMQSPSLHSPGKVPAQVNSGSLIRFRIPSFDAISLLVRFRWKKLGTSQNS